MRILHILDHAPPLQSGYVFRTLGILGAQQGFGWETIALTTPRNHAFVTPLETIDGRDFYRTPKPAGWLARQPVARELLEMRAVAARITGLIEHCRPDIIHAHSPVLNGLPALRAARRAGLPLVYEVRAFWEDAAVDLGQSRPGGARYRITRGLETWLLCRADAVVTLCAAMQREIESRGVPPGRISVVPNAVDPAHFSLSRTSDPALAASLGLQSRTVLGFIGSFYHYEGLDLLLTAMPAIRAALPQAMLLLVGGGPQDAALRAQAASLGLDDAVRFTGRVPHAEVQRYYDLVDFFIYPRHRIRLTELVTPLKPLEAMAQGRITIASDIGGHRELIRDGETGFLFPPDDPVALASRVAGIIAATDQHARVRAAARHFIETERTWAHTAAAYRPLYERLSRR